MIVGLSQDDRPESLLYPVFSKEITRYRKIQNAKYVSWGNGGVIYFVLHDDRATNLLFDKSGQPERFLRSAGSPFPEGTSVHWTGVHGGVLTVAGATLEKLRLRESHPGSAISVDHEIDLPPGWLVSRMAVSPDRQFLAATNCSVSTISGTNATNDFFAGLSEGRDLFSVSTGSNFAPHYPGPPFLHHLGSNERVRLQSRHRESLLYEVLEFSPDSRFLVSFEGGSQDTPPVFHLVVWDTWTGKIVTVQNYPNYLRDFAFSPDGKYLVAGDLHSPTLYVWDAQNNFAPLRQVEMKHDDHKEPWGAMNQPTFTPDSKYVVAVHSHQMKQGVLNRLVTVPIASVVNDAEPQPLSVLPLENGLVGKMIIRDDGDQIFTGVSDDYQSRVLIVNDFLRVSGIGALKFP